MPGPGDRPVESIGEQAAVRQAGELVVQPTAAQLLLGTALLADVRDHDKQPRRLRVVREGADAQPKHSLVPVGMRVGHLVLLGSRRRRVPELLHNEGALVAYAQQVPGAAGLDGPRRDAEDLHELVVGEDGPSTRFGGPDAFQSRVDQHPKLAFRHAGSTFSGRRGGTRDHGALSVIGDHQQPIVRHDGGANCPVATSVSWSLITALSTQQPETLIARAAALSDQAVGRAVLEPLRSAGRRVSAESLVRPSTA